MNELSFVTSDEPTRKHYLEQFVFFGLPYPLPRESVFSEPLPSKWTSISVRWYWLQRKRMLANRYVAKWSYSSQYTVYRCIYTLAYLLHARTVEPPKQLFLSNTRKQQWNNGVMQPSSRQRLGKHISAHAQWRHNPTEGSRRVFSLVRGSRVIEDEMARRLHSDLKC
jgi:hypothetical protein